MIFKNAKEADVKNRIISTLKMYPENDAAAVMWKGYITAALVKTKRRFTPEDYDAMIELLPQAGDEEQHVYAGGGAATLEERQAHLDDYKEQMERIARKKGQK